MSGTTLHERFQHHLPLSTDELERIWNTAILTVDANVLLDLYRYHATTREKLLDALAAFSGRLWLSHQAAEEFFRNRQSVIASALGEFDIAEEALKTFDKALVTAVERLRSVRPITREIAETLNSQVRPLIETARQSTREARTAHPNYFADDPVLNKILGLFDAAVGPEPSAQDRVTLEQEGMRRVQEKIPPGFLDAPKDGTQSSGDYVLWHQILEHAKQAQLPMLLVTSEKGEDWWEKPHGRRIAPRLELIKEALAYAGQRVVLYERDHFLTEVAARQGVKVDKSVLREVRALEYQKRSTEADDADLERLAEDVVHRFATRLVNEDDTITSLIAETNAVGYYLDELEFINVGPLELDVARIPFHARTHFSGDQLEDRMACGDTITAELKGTLEYDGTEWNVTEYELEEAEIERDDDNDNSEHE